MGRISKLFGMVATAGAVGALVRQVGRKRALRQYEAELERALADGELTAAEREQLEKLRAAEHLSAAEVRLIAVATYRRALRDALADDRLSAEEESRLEQLRAQLGLTEAELRDDARQLQRLRLLAAVERGRVLPAVTSPFTLDGDERCHWIVRGTACDEITVPGTPRLPVASQRFPLPGGEAFEVSGERGTLDTDPAVLPLDLGLLVVTDRRAVFRGARKRIEIPLERVEAVSLFADGVRLDVRGGRRRTFIVEDPELTGAVLYHAARRRQLPGERAERPTVVRTA